LVVYVPCVCGLFPQKVVFRLSGEKEFKFYGDRTINTPRLIAALHATQLIVKGCIGFLACVTEDKTKAKIEEIPVVREFTDVFPDELPGMPPNREIELTIDLLPGTAPYPRLLIRWHHENSRSLRVNYRNYSTKVLFVRVYHHGEHMFYS
jgi:hypothetical protein